jgi:uncharacterized protein
MTDLAVWETRLQELLAPHFHADPAHDPAHLTRVWRLADRLAADEETRTGTRADRRVLLAAAYLHDLINLPKNHPDRAKASTLSAEKAVTLLAGIGYPADTLPGVAHAIQAHSFSANIPPTTFEAKLLQDADRMEALGAIGLARVFAVSGQLGLALFHPTDPLARHRPVDDSQWAVDHFFAKLLKLPAQMQTAAGAAEAARRAQVLTGYLDTLAAELGA